MLYRQGQWWTPDGPGVLSGIMRQFLISKAGVRGSACPLKWLDDSEAMILTNCGSFIQPVASVTDGDGRSMLFDPQHRAIASLAALLPARSGVPAGL
jgi:branched-subunit amino acid aminotransferase/4-amino-4-deoxychorismate lyase